MRNPDQIPTPKSKHFDAKKKRRAVKTRVMLREREYSEARAEKQKLVRSADS